MDERKDTVWQSSEVAQSYLRDTRGAIPGAGEQIKVMLRLIESIGRPVKVFLDIGCGDGVLGATVFEAYPSARGVFLDFSSEMIESAKTRLDDSLDTVFLDTDYGKPEWKYHVGEFGPYDAIVSGFSIHHQPDERKREIYSEIFDLLASGGVFVNIEHVSPTSKLGRALFEKQFVDSLYALEREQGGGRSREQIAREYHGRADKDANILAPVDAQCQWLRDIGYTDVDCYLKIYELAVFAAKKP